MKKEIEAGELIVLLQQCNPDTKVMLAIYDDVKYDPTKYYRLTDVEEFDNLIRLSNL